MKIQVRSGVDFTAVEPLHIKGKTEPVATFCPRRIPRDRGAFQQW